MKINLSSQVKVIVMCTVCQVKRWQATWFGSRPLMSLSAVSHQLLVRIYLVLLSARGLTWSWS